MEHGAPMKLNLNMLFLDTKLYYLLKKRIKINKILTN